MEKEKYTPGQILSQYISAEEWETIRNDRELRNEAMKEHVKLVKRELAKIKKERRSKGWNNTTTK